MAQKTILNPKRKAESFTAVLKDGTEAIYKVHVPNFTELQAAFLAMTTVTGKMDLVGAGLTIFNLCCFEYNQILDSEENAGAMISICLSLATTYVSDVSTEIKKN